MSLQPQTMQFTPFESFFDPGFWSKFYDNKLEIYKLDDSGVPLLLQYSTTPHISLQPKLNAYGELAFNIDTQTGSQTTTSPCTLLNYNSFQGFKESDKKGLLSEYSTMIWADILNNNIAKQPSLLNRTFIISYADLKQYLYTHWMCMPALVPSGVGFNVVNNVQFADYVLPLSSTSTESSTLPIIEWAQIINKIQDLTQNPVFIINKNTKEIISLNEFTIILDQFFLAKKNDEKNPENNSNDFNLSNYLFTYLDPVATPTATGWFARNMLLYIGMLLASYDIDANNENKNGYKIDFFAIKNTRELQLSYQELLLVNKNAQHQAEQQKSHTSIIYTIDIIGILGENSSVKDGVNFMNEKNRSKNDKNLAEKSTEKSQIPPTPPSNGWEKYKNKPQPRQTSAKNLDPLQIYTQAGDMNLKLLKWQHWPEMPLPSIRQQRCLLIGSGTLGCYVARLLLGWGITHITMLDYGKVSASNPVRQPLFTYNDWFEKKYKANAACDALRKISPKATLTPIVLSIPSAGTISENEMSGALDNAKKLAELVQLHDIVFLLTDSRASRWLPTLLCQAYGKRTVAAAIGAETYVAMRHGVRQGWEYTLDANQSTQTVLDNDLLSSLAHVVETNDENNKTSKNNSNDNNNINDKKNNNKDDKITELGFGTFKNKPNDVCTSGALSCGCYFCPDQAAPILGIPQSIDQQCTVTRAEVAALASSYAVNLFVHDVTHECTFLFNKNKENKESDEKNNENQDENNDQIGSSLIEIPTECKICEYNSQVRGHVLTHVNPTVESNSISCPPSSTCVACGKNIIESFQKDPIGFLVACLTDADNVSKFSGFNPIFEAAQDWDNDEWDMSGDDLSDDLSD